MENAIETISGFIIFSYLFIQYEGATNGVPISPSMFAALFLLPASVTGLSMIVRLLSKRVRGISLIALLGISWGSAGTFSLLGLMTLFHWYKNPANGSLDPLFTAFGLAAASAEASRRGIHKTLKTKHEPE
jgi:hypothetical protein